MPRIAIVDKEKCQPSKCNKECIKSCPPQKQGLQVIEIEDITSSIANISNITNKKIAKISESLCIGCNLCVSRCPFKAIKIINLPDENPKDIIHRYSTNGFRLYKLPIMRKNCVIGIIGENGIGKTTIIDILAKNIIPNLENFIDDPNSKNVLNHYKGTIMLSYLTNLYNNKLKINIKQQNVHAININNQSVYEYVISELKTNDIYDEFYYLLELNLIINNNLDCLSGGELQKLLCWIIYKKEADVYIFDEPSNFLDVKQRINICKMLRSLVDINKYIVLIEHDLSMMDYVCDDIYIIYGIPGAYGIVSMVQTPLEGINNYLDGFIPAQNIRFRNEEYNFKQTIEINNNLQNVNDKKIFIDSFLLEREKYKLIIPNDNLIISKNITIILGENGTGKTSYINYLISKNNICSISYKNQKLTLENNNLTVSDILQTMQINANNQIFINDVIKPLNIKKLLSRKLNELSGGELQKVFITLCLGTEAELYILDEPSANLDIETRLKLTKILKNFILNNNKSLIIVEHDLSLCANLAANVKSSITIVKIKEILKDNTKICQVIHSLTFNEGINDFLKILGITMRLSTKNRPRINKLNSRLDEEQKKCNQHYR